MITMRWLTAWVAWVTVLAAGAVIAESLPLPVWSEQDRARLRSGELVAGAAILVEDSSQVVLPKVPPEPELPSMEPVEPVPEYDPVVIPEEFLADYFVTQPRSYLVDPQRLLSKQESLDREGFLEYHANDSELDIRMYLFDAQQQIPEPYTIQNLCRDRYAGEPLTAVVFCYLGDPSRTEIGFGGDGAAEISTSERRKMLESAMIKAMEKSDPSMQLESFIVQLSIRLYWLERERIKKRALAAAENDLTGSDRGEESASLAGGQPDKPEAGPAAMVRTYTLFIVAGLLGFISLCVGLWLAWSTWMRSRRYHFPVFEVPERLGANYAAGVGAVIAFHRKLGSPSSQRDQVPDYLTRV